MPAKHAALIDQLGERGLLLPEFIARGLAANDRVTYYLTLLQAAKTRAHSVEQPFSDLRMQREASGVTDATLDHVVEASADRGNNMTYIPGAGTILEQLFGELRRMVVALRTAGAIRTEVQDRAGLYQQRLDDLISTLPSCIDDQMASGTIDALTTLSRNGHDTVHQLIVDLHGELTQLQADVPAERIDGAQTFGLTDRDRVLVHAFQMGLNQTSPLKFDHPGLQTTAAREGRMLSIQNDLGVTDDDLVVLQIEDLAINISYTDVHHSRVRFFQDLLQPYGVMWTAEPVPPGAAFEVSAGKYTAETPERLERFLSFIGSRLVFLIDWNRARKRLARLVSKTEATDMLKWSADNDVGHRAFLQIGGTRVIETVCARALPLPMRFGVRLDEQIGRYAARMFLMSVLRIASAGLSAGQSQRLIEDKIEAELLRYLESPDHQLLAGFSEHAAMLAAIGERIRQDFLKRRTRSAVEGDSGPSVVRTWIARAQEMLQQDPIAVDTSGQGAQLTVLMTHATAAADALEETAFLLPLLPAAIEPATLGLLETLVEQTGAAARRYVRCLEQAQHLSHSSERSEVEDFLATVDQLAALGRDAVKSRRGIVERLMHATCQCQELYVVLAMGQGLERASLVLARCGAMVKDQVLRTRLRR